MSDKQKNIFVLGGIVCAVVLVICLIIVAIHSGGTTRVYNADASKFKKEYEALNDQTNANGKTIRKVNINEDNPFTYSTVDEILKKVEKGETFIVYFGFPNCPWCRSVIEKAIEVANKENIKTIYYINIRNENNEEILRDQYRLGKKNKVVLDQEAGEGYKDLLRSNLLS